MRRVTLAVGLVLLPLRLHAAVSNGRPPMEWLEPTTAEQQEALAASPAYQRFLDSAPGPWSAEFDPVLRTPRAILGDGVTLFPADSNENGVRKAVLRFLDDHSALFGASRGDFVIDGLVSSRDLWVVAVAQRYRGIPVHGSHLSLSIKQGRLILIQGVAHRVDGVDHLPQESLLGPAHGDDWLLAQHTHAAADVREAVAFALGGRPGPAALDALIALSADAEPRVRDWATFALGTLAEADSAPLRDALAARLDDADEDTRLEAVHGLAVRGDARAEAPARALLAAHAGDEDSVWTRHLLSETASHLP